MTDVPGAKEKLARSRAALLAAMGYRSTGTQPRSLAEPQTDSPADPQWTRAEKEHRRAPSASSAFSARIESKVEHSVLGRWWRRSHLSTAAELGTPFLQHYAARHPAKLMAYAAGTGSLIVLVKPWRLLSVGMVVGLLVRSTDLAGFLSDYLVPQLGDTDGPRDDFLERPPG